MRPYTRRTLLGGVLAAMGLTCAALAAQPRLTCAERAYTFGTVANIETVDHTFRLVNAGDAPLNIQRVRVCCGATADLSAQSIPAGGSADVRVHLSLAGRIGPQKKTIHVISDDPTEPYYELQLVGTATAEVEAVPSRVDFGDVDERAAVEKVVWLKATTGLTFQVTAVTTTVAWCRAEAIRGESNAGYRVMVRTVPPLPSGAATGRVVLRTDLHDYPRIELPVSARVDSDVVVVPHEILLKPTAGNTATETRYVALRRRGGKTFRVLEVETPRKDVRVETAPLGSFGYRFAVSGCDRPSELDGRFLTIHTDIPGLEEIDVPFRLERGEGE